MSANPMCTRRLTRELKALMKDPLVCPKIIALPQEDNILIWHYLIEGNADTSFDGGIYWGKLIFPPEYPLKPPSIQMQTPNGRFVTNRRLCLSMSDYHPETWNPMWSLATILTGLYSFMNDKAPTAGSIVTTTAQKQKYATQSLAFNCASPMFSKMFPDYVELHQERLRLLPPESAAAAAAITSDAHGDIGEGGVNALIAACLIAFVSILYAMLRYL